MYLGELGLCSKFQVFAIHTSRVYTFFIFPVNNQRSKINAEKIILYTSDFDMHTKLYPTASIQL